MMPSSVSVPSPRPQLALVTANGTALRSRSSQVGSSRPGSFDSLSRRMATRPSGTADFSFTR